MILSADVIYPAMAYTPLTGISAEPSLRTFVETAPPPAPVRPVAEFDPATQVIIKYPLGFPTSLVTDLANTAQVVCLVASTSVQSQATSAFQSAGVNMANVIFLLADTNSYWTRDFGPWFIFNGNNALGVVDFPYNRPRPLDDEVPRTFATTYNYPLYGMNLSQTGGNYMADGINTCAQTTLVYDENTSQTQAQVNQKMLDYMGATHYMTMADPNNTYIDHIDCWGKFLAPDKVLIRSVPTSHSQYTEIEAVANWFANQNCAWGYPYKVYRVNTPQNQPYTNSLILNHRVFVPIMNSTYDQAALNAYAAALPGYTVTGVTGLSSAPWESTDALHCRTHEVPDRNMLFVQHMPLHHQNTLQPAYSINAYIYPHSNTALIPDSVKICYKVNLGPWQSTLLTPIGNNMLTTTLSGFAPGDTIRYFIHAADLSGHSINHPLTGAADPHKFWITPDNIPPVIVHTPITGFSAPDLPLNLTATVTDNYAVANVQLTYRIDNGMEQTVAMNHTTGDTYEVSLQPDIPGNAQYFYYKIIATDAVTPQNTATLPSQDWFIANIIPTAADSQTAEALATRLISLAPNPLSLAYQPLLTAVYSGKAGQKVKLELFNVKGQLMQAQTALCSTSGQHAMNFSLDKGAGERLSAGVYFVRLTGAGRPSILKCVVLP